MIALYNTNNYVRSESSSIGGDDDSSLRGCYTVLCDKYSPSLWRHCPPVKYQYLFIGW